MPEKARSFREAAGSVLMGEIRHALNYIFEDFATLSHMSWEIEIATGLPPEIIDDRLERLRPDVEEAVSSAAKEALREVLEQEDRT